MDKFVLLTIVGIFLLLISIGVLVFQDERNLKEAIFTTIVIVGFAIGIIATGIGLLFVISALINSAPIR